MSKKVTKQIIRNNMESFAAFVEHAEAHLIVAVDENGNASHVDAKPVVFGAWAMAQYVQAIIDGEAPIENDLNKLAGIVVNAALTECSHRDDEDDGDEAEDENEADAFLDRLIASLSKRKTDSEGGAGDDADAE